jgi:hypothetical protein
MLLGFAQILIFLSFPTEDSERLPAVASQQIAFASGKREKLLLPNQTKLKKCFALFLTKGKRFVLLSQIFH